MGYIGSSATVPPPSPNRAFLTFPRAERHVAAECVSTVLNGFTPILSWLTPGSEVLQIDFPVVAK